MTAGLPAILFMASAGIVSNAGPLISLARIDRLDLSGLFGEIMCRLPCIERSRSMISLPVLSPWLRSIG